MTGPLHGVRVLDLTQVMAGPFCTMLLADLGADVVKLESPGGDSTRSGAGAVGHDSPGFNALNRNKRGIVLNLKDPRGRELARELARRSDVLVENYRPGVMAEFGLDYETLSALNPALVYCSISGFGHTGPYAQRGGFDLVAQGMSGLMSVTGEPGGAPVKCGIPVTDLGAGLFALQGVLSAYIQAQRTGRGQRVDTSLLEAGIALSVWEATQYFRGGGIPEPVGSAHRVSAPYQAVRCADGYINIGAANQRTWEKFCTALGRPGWAQRPEYASDPLRVQNRVALAAEIEAVTGTDTRQHWLGLLERHGVPAGPILDYAEVFADPHVQARGMRQEVQHPALGGVSVLGNPVKYSAWPGQYGPAPGLGQHTRAVLAELGLSAGQIDELHSAGIAVCG